MKKSYTPQLFFARVVPILVMIAALPAPGSGGFARAQKLGAGDGRPTQSTRPVTPTGIVPTHPFEPAEELVYVAEFSRGLLKKVDVADFHFTASREPSLERVVFNKEPGTAPYSLKFIGDVSSRGFFTRLFNLHFRERIESIVEPVSFTVTNTKRLDEQGKRARTSETVYRDGKVTWVERDPNDPTRPPRVADAEFTGQVQDLVSAIYYLRTQPLAVGKFLELTVIDSGLVYQVPVRAIETKRKKTVLGRVETLRVDAEIFGPDRMIAGDGQFSIWFTNDKRRIPVSARIKLKFGTFDITLRKAKKNAGPLEAVARARGQQP